VEDDGVETITTTEIQPTIIDSYFDNPVSINT